MTISRVSDHSPALSTKEHLARIHLDTDDICSFENMFKKMGKNNPFLCYSCTVFPRPTYTHMYTHRLTQTHRLLMDL